MTSIAPRFFSPLAVLALLGFASHLQATDGTPARTTGSAPDTEERRSNHRTTDGNCELNAMEQELLERINEARSQARQCGDEAFEATQPLAWNCQLETAAEAHSSDMAANDFFSHTGPEGADIRDRVNATGYTWMAVGENIASGHASVTAVVDGWLASPGHCANIMSDKFTEMGVAKAEAQGSVHSPYWTQVLARPR